MPDGALTSFRYSAGRDVFLSSGVFNWRVPWTGAYVTLQLCLSVKTRLHGRRSQRQRAENIAAKTVDELNTTSYNRMRCISIGSVTITTESSKDTCA